MNRTVLLSVLLTISPGLGADERVESLPSQYRKWLEEEVVYIITDREKEVFLSIETLERRNRFIDAFWRKRDPNLVTPENEFKEEHYRRLQHANEFLGQETFRPGWKTDRGRFYIILGEPRENRRFDGYNELVSVELWFYQGDPSLGLPSFFYLMFFRHDDMGEYRLYHPVVDGPAALLRGRLTYGSDAGAALEVLGRISPEIARASLSFDTSEPADFFDARASLGTELMLARVEESPKRAIRSDYADAFLRYGNRVSAEYSFNFVRSRSYFAVLAGPQETSFVHFSIEIEPQNFALETDEEKSKFYTTLDLDIEVRDGEGRLVVARVRELYLELTPSQFQQGRASPFSFQADVALVPGQYSIIIIIKNRVLNQYTVAEREIEVPMLSDGSPGLSDLVLGYKREIVGDMKEDETRAFQVGNVRIHPALEGVFTLGETVHLLTQVHGAGSDYGLRFALRKGQEKVQGFETRLAVYQGAAVVEEFPLMGMVGGDYVLEVALIDPTGQVVAEKSTPLRVSPRTSIPRPAFTYRRSFDTAAPGLLALTKGQQLWNLDRREEAIREFEEAVAADNPNLTRARWKLAAVLVNTGKWDRALALLAPLEEGFPNQFEVIAGLGFAHYFKQDFARALDYLERAMTLRAPDTSLLNALGDSYERLGRSDKARETYERSLELDPGQKVIQERLQSMKKATDPEVLWLHQRSKKPL